MHSKTRQDFRI